eukprot:contig_26624_g6543
MGAVAGSHRARRQLLEAAVSGGTARDRIAARALRIQQSPVHRLDDIRALVTAASKVHSSHSSMTTALDAAADLFVHDLLPPDRRLRLFQALQFGPVPGSAAGQDAGAGGKVAITKRHLAYAHFEGELKGIYAQLVSSLSVASHATVAHTRKHAIHITLQLLMSRPEAEASLLAVLINKLGDPERLVAAAASHALARLMGAHEAMAPVVASELERMVRRPGLSTRAQYYAVLLLGNTRFVRERDVELSRSLVTLYMELFADCLARDAVDRSAGRLLTPQENAAAAKKKQRLKRIRHRKAAAAAERGDAADGRASSLSTAPPTEERKESRLMGALLAATNRAFPYTSGRGAPAPFSLFAPQLDALFTVAHARSFRAATHALALLRVVTSTSRATAVRYYRALYAQVGSEALLAARPRVQARFLGVVLVTMRNDTDSARVAAFAKRLLIMAVHAPAHLAAASLLVISSAASGEDTSS